MPILEKYEVQQNRIWYRVDITEEQKEEYLKWQAEIEDGWDVVSEANVPEWMDDLDWSHQYDKPGHAEVISIELVNEGE